MKGFPAFRWAGLALGAWLSFAAAAPAAGEARVSVDVQPRLLRLGESARLEIVFEGIDFDPDVRLPDIPDVSVQGPSVGRSTSFSFVNGRSQQTSTLTLGWTLTPRRTGDIVLGPWDLDVGGKTLQFPRHVLAVKERDPVDDRSVDAIFARMVLPGEPPVVGQDFPWSIEIWHLPELALDSSVGIRGGLPETGFRRGDLRGHASARAEHDGRIYQVERYAGNWRALAAGEYEFAPNVVATVLQPRRRDPWGDPWGMGMGFDLLGPSGTPVELPAPLATLRVVPVPEEGRPANWSGGVGDYRLEARVGPEEVRVGEPVTVTLTLSGDGDLETPRLPAYADAPQFKAYEPKANSESGAGGRVVDQVVIPRTEALTELPPLEFSFYDPAAHAYRTRTVGPFPVRVLPGAAGSSALLVTGDGGTAPPAGPVVLGSDIHYLHDIPERWPPPQSFGELAVPGALHGGALVALAALAAVRHRRRRLRSDVAFARRLRAPRVSRAHLRAAEGLLARGAEPAAVLDELHLAVTAYFGHRLNLPPGDATPERVMAALPAGDEALRGGFAEFFALADSVRYGSSAIDPETLAAWPRRLAGLLRDAERSNP